ncbi:MAG TPA: pyrimidine 5'-nucleotidase [Chloroflexi bacterium]|nr:pyrimidine 5'-nucleotidase [Chloroflexota bacterium]
MGYKLIIFDLDDTLYPRDTGLMQEIGHRIQVWVRDYLEVTWEEAQAVRHDYWQRYGTTLGGLMAEHQVDIQDYLTFVHDIPLHEYLAPDPALAEMLEALPLRKAIYTNATVEHGWRVLRALGVADHFDRVIGIEDVEWRNKPRRDAFERTLSHLGAAGPECIMVEDSPRNLRPAKELGLTTILVDAEPDENDVVDFVVESVLDVEKIVNGLLGLETGGSGDEGSSD